MIPLFLPFLLARLLSSRRCFFSCLVVSFTCLDRARNSPEISLARPVLPVVALSSFAPLFFPLLSCLSSRVCTSWPGPARLLATRFFVPARAVSGAGSTADPPFSSLERQDACSPCVRFVCTCMYVCICVCVCVVARLRRTEDVKFIEIVTNRVCTTCRTHR